MLDAKIVKARHAILALTMAAPTAFGADIQIPRSMVDRGTYWLLERKQVGPLIRALHKRVGPSGTGYTLTETDCAKMTMRELGYSEESPQAIVPKPGKWFDLVEGSSKSDLARFLCRTPR